MASVKNLKKDINYVLGDLISECVVWEMINSDKDKSQSKTIVDEIIVTFDDLISKVNQKNIDNKKAHFKSVYSDLEDKSNQFITKIANL